MRTAEGAVAVLFGLVGKITVGSGVISHASQSLGYYIQSTYGFSITRGSLPRRLHDQLLFQRVNKRRATFKVNATIQAQAIVTYSRPCSRACLCELN